MCLCRVGQGNWRCWLAWEWVGPFLGCSLSSRSHNSFVFYFIFLFCWKNMGPTSPRALWVGSFTYCAYIFMSDFMDLPNFCSLLVRFIVCCRRESEIWRGDFFYLLYSLLLFIYFGLLYRLINFIDSYYWFKHINYCLMFFNFHSRNVCFVFYLWSWLKIKFEVKLKLTW